jgi:hypothetical protein
MVERLLRDRYLVQALRLRSESWFGSIGAFSSELMTGKPETECRLAITG